MRTRWLAVFCLTITVCLFWDAQTFAGDDSADDRVQRHCFGLIWCVERSADGVSIDGLLWLYSSEERGNYSRLTIRPFYSIEEDPTKNLLRRSILWPLGTYERRGDQVWSHVLPLYSHSEWPGSEWTFVAPLYWKSIHEEDAWYHLFPLFSRHTRGQYYARTFVLGPLLMITRDSRTDLTQWDLFFFIFHSRQDVNSSESWVSPIYWSGKDRASATSYRYVFPLYGSSDSETQHYRFLFPFYGSDVDTEKHTSRLALLGLPPFKGSYGTTTLSLFESATSPDESRHRLFPLYQYRHDLVADETEFDALLLYRHLSTPTRVADRLLPLWDYGSATDGTAWNLSLLGVDTFALYHHRQTEQRTVDRLFPLHDYLRDGAASSLSLLGLAEVALYRQEASPTLFRHRLFPLYQYRHDLVADATEFDALLLYRHLSTPTRVADRLLEEMGLGWNLGHYKDVITVSHGGGGFGWNAFLLILPERNYATVILSNEESNAHVRATRAVADVLLEEEPQANSVSWMIPISRALAEGGIEAAYARYTEIKAKKDDEFFFHEHELIALVLYQLFTAKKIDLAIEVLGLNIHVYPEYIESYLEQAKLYLYKGEIVQAKESLLKALAEAVSSPLCQHPLQSSA